MNFHLFRCSIAITAALMSSAAFGAPAKAPNFKQVTVTRLSENFDACHADDTRLSVKAAETNIKLMIAADGALEKFDLPEGSHEWMQELAGCALDRFRFAPATLDGVPIEGIGFLQFTLRAREPGQSAGVVIEGIGPLVTPPRMWAPGRNTSNCYPEKIIRLGKMGRMVAVLTIGPDGSVTKLTLPAGNEPWHESTARCIVDKIAFSPGTRDGLPVEAEVELPITLKIGEGELAAPKLRSTGDELEAAYRACYPAELLSIATVGYRFTISPSGRATKAEVVSGSGNPELDAVGTCILGMLEFTPFKQNGRNLRSNVVWELPIRPPR